MKSYHYAQIDEQGNVVSDSYLSGEFYSPLMIPIDGSFNPFGKRYVNGEWVDIPVEELGESEVTE